MRLFLASAACLIAATAAHAGSYTGSGGKAATTHVVVSSPSECTGILVGGCGYCIGGKVYHF